MGRDGYLYLRKIAYRFKLSDTKKQKPLDIYCLISPDLFFLSPLNSDQFKFFMVSSRLPVVSKMSTHESRTLHT